MRKILILMLGGLLLCGCDSGKKSSLGAEVSRSPKIQTITESELESLADTEENYFVLFCGGTDITCQAIVEDTRKLKLNQPAAYYFFDLDEAIMATSAQDSEAAQSAIQDFLTFMNRYAITRMPTVHYYQGAKRIKTYNIQEQDGSRILTEEEEQARIAGFRTWMNNLKG